MKSMQVRRTRLSHLTLGDKIRKQRNKLLRFVYFLLICSVAFFSWVQHQTVVSNHWSENGFFLNPVTLEPASKSSFRKKTITQTIYDEMEDSKEEDNEESSQPTNILKQQKMDATPDIQRIQQQQQNISESTPDDAPPSLTILFNIMNHFKPPDNHTFDGHITDEVEERERCQKYGFEYKGRNTRRRIFYGALIADDSWHVIFTHAAEAHGLYHSAAFVESNATTSHDHTQSRATRFGPGSSELQTLESGIFGPKTKVTVDYYVDHPEERKGNDVYDGVETLQRELIAQRWKENGMTEEDIGIVGDIDEMFSRDFLLAAQSCDVPQFRPNQDCRRPKILASTVVFESSPECFSANRIWHHPDMMIGQCVDRIGNSDVHKPGKRLWNGKGPRVEGYGLSSGDYSQMPNITKYPLWTPNDFRVVEGGDMLFDKDKKPIGIHLHNFFLSTSSLRNKYLTYSHPDLRARTKPLSLIHEDLNFTINCVMDRPDDPKYHGWNRVKEGFDGAVGAKPVLFQQSKEYRKARQEELREMIMKDEKQFG